MNITTKEAFIKGPVATAFATTVYTLAYGTRDWKQVAAVCYGSYFLSKILKAPLKGQNHTTRYVISAIPPALVVGFRASSVLKGLSTFLATAGYLHFNWIARDFLKNCAALIQAVVPHN